MSDLDDFFAEGQNLIYATFVPTKILNETFGVVRNVYTTPMGFDCLVIEVVNNSGPHYFMRYSDDVASTAEGCDNPKVGDHVVIL